jgi:hypothetical protein
MSHIHRGVVAVLSALALAAPGSAQSSSAPDANRLLTHSSAWATASAFDVTPSSENATHDSTLATFAAPAFPGQTRESRNVALMIVGGAAIAVGAVVGGDAGTIMMVGGGVIGLIGLYRYVR